VAKLLAPVSSLLLGFWLIITVVSIDHGWAAEFGDAGDPTDVSGKWVSRGTLFTPPLWQLVAGVGLALLGVLYLVGGLAEPIDPAASDPNVVVYWLLRLVGLAGAAALVVTAAAAAIAAWRRA
jgi:hypothetical protein